MKTQIICLANSYKEGGRCLAGIEIQNGKPVITNGKSKWIRPVCETEHGQIPNNLVQHLNLLDIVEIDITEFIPDSYQPENALFEQNSIKIVDKFPIQKLSELCNHRQRNLFGNTGKAVAEEKVRFLSKSLTLIKVQDAKIQQKQNEGRENPQIRIKFSFNGNAYDLPVTDPMFLNLYKANDKLITDGMEVFLTISLAILQNGWHSKLVAGIIY